MCLCVQVYVKEARGRVDLVGLSSVSVKNEKEGYQQIFKGDAYRHLEQTALNPETSTGHTFFIVRTKEPRSSHLTLCVRRFVSRSA